MPRLNGAMHGGLHVFATAARCLSFTQAAGELHITTGAVSQQIKQLEARLGFRLFHRHHRRLSLTPEGQRLASVVIDAYGQVDQEIERLSRSLMSGEIRLRALPSFLARWLLPRLPRLRARLPELDLRLQAEDSSQSLANGDFDLAIDLGEGVYPGMRTTPLMAEEIFPVCAPSLLRGRPILRQPADLAWYPLLHDVTAWRGSSDHAEWEAYLEAIGAPAINVQRGYTFNRHDLTIAAAITGMGVAIARRTLLSDEISSGQLIAPFRERIATGKQYVLVHPPGALDDPRISAVHDWLLDELKRPQQ